MHLSKNCDPLEVKTMVVKAENCYKLQFFTLWMKINQQCQIVIEKGNVSLKLRLVGRDSQSVAGLWSNRLISPESFLIVREFILTGNCLA